MDADLLDDLMTGPLDLFCSRYIFDRTPHVFQDDWIGYLSWKAKLGSLLNVDSHDLVMIGSAAVGVSLSPTKNLRPFDDESDIDIAVVSQRHFDIAWRHLRSLGSSQLSMPAVVRDAIRDHKKHYVYLGVIATDQILVHLPFGPDWQRHIASMAKDAPTIGRNINMRLYHDSDALRFYHIEGLLRIRNQRLEAQE